jgi:predicted NBD/HSP70 family sugar kinase
MRAVRTTATYLAAGMTSLVNTLSPERVLLLGFLADLHRAAGDVVREELMKSSIVARAGQVTITTGSLRYPVLLGGAERAFACVLTDPRTAMRGGTR